MGEFSRVRKEKTKFVQRYFLQKCISGEQNNNRKLILSKRIMDKLTGFEFKWNNKKTRFPQNFNRYI